MTINENKPFDLYEAQNKINDAANRIYELERELDRLRAIEAAQAWVSVETPPEDDGTLNPDDCDTRFTGNEYVVTACRFWCKFKMDEDQEYTDVVVYDFEQGAWILRFEGNVLDIVVTHWKKLPDPPVIADPAKKEA